MQGKEALYPLIQRRVEKAKKKLEESGALEENKRHILGFLVKLEADGTSNAQMLSYLDRLTPIALLLGRKDFKETTRKDMEEVFARYRKGYAQSSLNKVVQCLKCFYRWLFDLSSADAAPEAVRWMKKESCPNILRAEDLWTEEDMQKALSVTRTLRDKCILSVLYETGLHNLTEPKTALMIHFGDQKKQKWTMERMNYEEPEQQQ